MLLVTGYPGWLTNVFLSYANERGASPWGRVRCLVQPELFLSSPRQNPYDENLEKLPGDLRSQEAVFAALQGVTQVLHAAGIVHVHRTKEWYTINRDCTKLLVDSAISAGVERFVFISSNAAGGRSTERGKLLSEEMRAQPLSHYGRSKFEAEQYLLSRAGDIEVVILRPCMFYGPPVPPRHIDIYRRICSGRMPLVGDGMYDRSVVHIKNLAELCYLALTREEAAGQTYYAADDRTYTTQEIVEAMASALDVNPRFLHLPATLATVAYYLDRFLAKMGIYWQNLHLVGEADWNVGVSCEKAKRELGYTARFTLKDGMNDAVQWCRSNKLL